MLISYLMYDSWIIPIEIDIKANHGPVTASWDHLLFIDSCNEGSVFTSVGQSEWWDVGSPSNIDRVNLREINEVRFSSNVRFYESGNINPNYAYTDSSAGNFRYFGLV